MPNNLGDLRAKPGHSFVGDLRSLLEGEMNQNKVQKTAWALPGWALPRVWCSGGSGAPLSPAPLPGWDRTHFPGAPFLTGDVSQSNGGQTDTDCGNYLCYETVPQIRSAPLTEYESP